MGRSADDKLIDIITAIILLLIVAGGLIWLATGCQQKVADFEPSVRQSPATTQSVASGGVGVQESSCSADTTYGLVNIQVGTGAVGAIAVAGLLIIILWHRSGTGKFLRK